MALLRATGHVKLETGQRAEALHGTATLGAIAVANASHGVNGRTKKKGKTSLNGEKEGNTLPD
jgi:hypothetical protein